MTNQTLDDQRLNEIEARINAAYPGPWWTDGREIYQGDTGNTPSILRWIGDTRRPDDWDGSRDNAAFIAHARTDVPALLAEVRRLRAELDAEKQAHRFTLRQRNNRSRRLLHLRDLAVAGDPNVLAAAALDTLAASVRDHGACATGEAEVDEEFVYGCPACLQPVVVGRRDEHACPAAEAAP